MITKLKLSEHEIQNLIIEYLRRKKWYVIRLNSGTMTKEYKGKKYFIRGQAAGTPDLMAFKEFETLPTDQQSSYIELLFIEVKSAIGRPTAIQTAKMKELEEYGAKCIVATCIEDLQKVGV